MTSVNAIYTKINGGWIKSQGGVNTVQCTASESTYITMITATRFQGVSSGIGFSENMMILPISPYTYYNGTMTIWTSGGSGTIRAILSDFSNTEFTATTTKQTITLPSNTIAVQGYMYNVIGESQGSSIKMYIGFTIPYDTI